MAAAAAAATLAVVALPIDDSDRQGERSAAPEPSGLTASQVTAMMARTYAVFGRPVGEHDLHPDLPLDAQRGRVTLFETDSRLAAELGDYKAYVIPGAAAQAPVLCTAIAIGNGQGGMACGNFSEKSRAPRTTRTVVDGGSVLLVLFPDGIATAELRLDDGTIDELSIRDNALLMKLDGEPGQLIWVDGGHERALNVE